jgi:hypothetical protein
LIKLTQMQDLTPATREDLADELTELQSEPGTGT